MRAKVIKALRKEMRRDLDAKYADFRAYLRGMSWWERLGVCIKLVINP
jgi:hypothetical protein